MHQRKLVDLATFRLIHQPNHFGDVCYIWRYPSNRLINRNFHRLVEDMAKRTNFDNNLSNLSSHCRAANSYRGGAGHVRSNMILLGQDPLLAGQIFTVVTLTIVNPDCAVILL